MLRLSRRDAMEGGEGAGAGEPSGNTEPPEISAGTGRPGGGGATGQGSSSSDEGAD